MSRFGKSEHDSVDGNRPQANPANHTPRPSRTHRPRNRIVAASSAIAVTVVLGLIVLAMVDPSPDEGIASTRSTDEGIARSTEEPVRVEFPKKVDPLPDEEVGPVVLTYLDENSWRVVVTDGTHYAVDDAAPGGEAGSGLVTVSPDGERIGYLRPDGSFVLRDLASGEVAEAFQWDPRVIDVSAQGAVWSPDGRSLLVLPGVEWGMGVGAGECVELDRGLCVYPPENPHADPVLLNTETMETVGLPDTYGDLLSMPNGDALFPYPLDFPYGIEMRGANEVSLPLFDHTGEQRGELPHEVIPGRQDIPPGKEKDGALGGISADGRTLVAMRDGSTRGDDDKLFVIDVESQQVVDEIPLRNDRTDFDSPEFHGWANDDEILMSAFDSVDGGKRTTYAINVDTGQKTAVLEAVLPPYGLVIDDVAYTLL